MAELPQRPRMPARYARFVDALLAWMREHDIVLVGDVSPERFPTGSKIPASTAAAAETSSLPTYPVIDGTYVLGVVVASGVPTLQWLETDTCA